MVELNIAPDKKELLKHNQKELQGVVQFIANLRLGVIEGADSKNRVFCGVTVRGRYIEILPKYIKERANTTIDRVTEEEKTVAAVLHEIFNSLTSLHDEKVEKFLLDFMISEDGQNPAELEKIFEAFKKTTLSKPLIAFFGK